VILAKGKKAARVIVRPVTVPWLGRRWVAHCERCDVDLPGRFCERREAQGVGDCHVITRHLGLSLDELLEATA
jgi:hypothetical protein